MVAVCVDVPVLWLSVCVDVPVPWSSVCVVDVWCCLCGRVDVPVPWLLCMLMCQLSGCCVC